MLRQAPSVVKIASSSNLTIINIGKNAIKIHYSNSLVNLPPQNPVQRIQVLSFKINITSSNCLCPKFQLLIYCLQYFISSICLPNSCHQIWTVFTAVRFIESNPHQTSCSTQQTFHTSPGNMATTQGLNEGISTTVTFIVILEWFAELKCSSLQACTMDQLEKITPQATVIAGTEHNHMTM